MITLQCRTCDEDVSSIWLDASDVVTCVDCWDN
jgi:hypothetical protein